MNRHTLIGLLLGGALVGAIWLWQANIADAPRIVDTRAPERIVTDWLDAAARGDVTTMLDLTVGNRHEQVRAERWMIERLVKDEAAHASRPAESAPVAADDGNAPAPAASAAGAFDFRFMLLPERHRTGDNGPEVFARLHRSGHSVVRRFHLTETADGWRIRDWDNVADNPDPAAPADNSADGE